MDLVFITHGGNLYPPGQIAPERLFLSLWIRSHTTARGQSWQTVPSWGLRLALVVVGTLGKAPSFHTWGTAVSGYRTTGEKNRFSFSPTSHFQVVQGCKTRVSAFTTSFSPAPPPCLGAPHPQPRCPRPGPSFDSLASSPHAVTGGHQPNASPLCALHSSVSNNWLHGRSPNTTPES